MTPRRIAFLLFVTILIPATAVLYHRLANLDAQPPSAATSMSPSSHPVIVVGSGLAGLSASYAALRAGASAVRLLERAAKPGGNSMKASSGINGAPTRFQAAGEPDTFFYSDTLRSAGSRLQGPGRPDREALIARLTGSSAAAVGFLVDDIGVDLAAVARLGGHSFARTHRGTGPMPPGAAIVFGLLGKLKADPRFELLTGCEVTRLLVSGDGGRVEGVEFTAADGLGTLAGPVVFATGGFAGDAKGLLATHRPDLTGLPSTNDARPGAHGVLTLAGARLVDMDAVQIHPTGFVDPQAPGARVKFLAAELLRGVGGVLLRRGKRFVDEMQTREVVSRAVMEGPAAEEDGVEVKQWDVQLLLDEGAFEVAKSHVGFYLSKGLMEKKKVSELDETTRETLKKYAKAASGQLADEFGRTTFGQWKLWTKAGGDDAEDAEVYVGRVTPITHFTMGGAVINEKAQVLASDLGESSGQKPIQGLWAAGEITGGIHGDNRLGGSSLLECVVYGLTAGEEAAKQLASQ